MSENAPREPWIGTWVGVNAAGVIRAGCIFREGDEESAREFVSSDGQLRPVRLIARNVKLDTPLTDYLPAGVDL